MREGESDSDIRQIIRMCLERSTVPWLGRYSTRIQTVHKNGLKRTLCPILSSSVNPHAQQQSLEKHPKTWKDYIQMTQIKTIEYVRPCRHMHLSLLHTILLNYHNQRHVFTRPRISEMISTNFHLFAERTPSCDICLSKYCI